MTGGGSALGKTTRSYGGDDYTVVDRDDVRVVLEYIGEGTSGDYDPEDPRDTPLLRFSVFRRVDGVWEEVDDASYCTALSARVPDSTQQKAAEMIMDEVYEPVHDGRRIKRLAERLSWLGETDVEAGMAPIGF